MTKPTEGGATKGRPKKQDGAIEWLKAYLADGPRLVNGIVRDAAEAGYSQRTLERIKPLAHVASLQTNGAKLWIDLDVSTPTVMAPMVTPGAPAALAVVPTIIQEAKEFVAEEAQAAAALAAVVPDKFPEGLTLDEIRALPPDEFMRNLNSVINTSIKAIKEHNEEFVSHWKKGEEVYERYNNKEYVADLIAKVRDYKTVMSEKIFAAKSADLREHEQKLVKKATKLFCIGTEYQKAADTPSIVFKEAFEDKVVWVQELSAAVKEELSVVRAAAEPDGEFLEDPMAGLVDSPVPTSNEG